MTQIKEDAYDTLNDWYSKKIINQSIHDPVLADSIALLDKIKNIPLLFMWRTDDYGEVNNSKDIAKFLDYMWNENNLTTKVRQWGKFFTDKT